MQSLLLRLVAFVQSLQCCHTYVVVQANTGYACIAIHIAGIGAHLQPPDHTLLVSKEEAAVGMEGQGCEGSLQQGCWQVQGALRQVTGLQLPHQHLTLKARQEKPMLLGVRPEAAPRSSHHPECICEHTVRGRATGLSMA